MLPIPEPTPPDPGKSHSLLRTNGASPTGAHASSGRDTINVALIYAEVVTSLAGAIHNILVACASCDALSSRGAGLRKHSQDRSCVAGLTFRSRRSARARLTLWTRWPSKTRLSTFTLRALCTLGTLMALHALRALGTLVACYTLWTLRSWWSGLTLWTRWPNRTGWSW